MGINLTMVILDLNTLSGTKPQILTSKRYDNHFRHFYMGILRFILAYYIMVLSVMI